MRIDPITRLTHSEFLSYNTVRIEAEYNDHEVGIATGFLYQFRSTNKTIVPALVTNKHVLENAQNLNLLFNSTTKDGKVDLIDNKIGIHLTLNNWYSHPNSNIDLAFVPLAAIMDNLHNEKKIPYMAYVVRENFPKPEEWSSLTALEEVVIAGYPVGIWDAVNNLPILRRGVTATHPKINFQGRPEFLVDAAVYIGSSGSPVFLYDDKQIFLGEELNIGKDKPRLAGILSHVYHQEQKGDMKSMPIPTIKEKKVPVINIPNNLGVVIKSTELDGFIALIDKTLAEEDLKK